VGLVVSRINRAHVAYSFAANTTPPRQPLSRSVRSSQLKQPRSSPKCGPSNPQLRATFAPDLNRPCGLINTLLPPSLAFHWFEDFAQEHPPRSPPPPMRKIVAAAAAKRSYRRNGVDKWLGRLPWCRGSRLWGIATEGAGRTGELLAGISP
jgi:hypothetical protein